jgi:hypothetical protein
MTILLLFAPGLLASFYYCRLRNLPVKSLEFFIFSILFSFLINLFIFGVAWLRGHGSAVASSLFNSISNVLKYGLLGLLAAFSLPNMLVLAENLLSRKSK